jgi:hypothetical protein
MDFFFYSSNNPNHILFYFLELASRINNCSEIRIPMGGVFKKRRSGIIVLLMLM